MKILHILFTLLKIKTARFQGAISVYKITVAKLHSKMPTLRIDSLKFTRH